MTTTREPAPSRQVRRRTLPSLVTDVVDEAVGRHPLPNPVVGRSGGPAGNARVTAWLGVLLLVSVSAQLVTLLDTRGLLSWHVAIGSAIAALALAKTAATGWRVVRYYRGGPHYRVAGPPPTVLRFLGPLLVVSTLGLVGSGIALVALGGDGVHRTLVAALGQRVDAVTVHQAFFIAFAVAVGVHVLGRLVPALQRIDRSNPVPGGAWRAGVVGLTLAAAALGIALLVPLAATYG